MAIFNRYPYTDFQQLNLDWILQELKDLTDEWASFEGQYEGITAEAQTVPYGSGASVTVTGGDGQPFNFDFSIPAGKNASVISTVVKYGTGPDSTTQPSTWYDQVPVIPQAYYLWTRVTINFSDGTQSIFYTVARNGMDGTGSVVTVNNVSPDAQGNVDLPMPQPSDNTPLMDTVYGNEGVSADYSRADHQHISDTSKLNVQSGTQIGDKNAYVVNDISTQTIQPISSSPVAGAIAEFDVNGCLLTNEPQTVYEVPRLLDVQNGFVSNSTITNYVAKTDKATASTLGIVQPDGVSITVDSDGIISSLSGGAFSTELVWTNASPTTSFGAQVISVDLSAYDYVYIIGQQEAASLNYIGHLWPNNFGYPFRMQRAGTSNGNNTGYRFFDISDTGVDVTVCTYNGATSNNYLIPYQIFGVKK